MTAQDGVTPLNAANVIHKTSDDTKDNSIIFYTYPGSIFQVYDANIQVSNLYRNPSAYYSQIEVLTGNYMIAPYYISYYRNSGTTFPSLYEIIPYSLTLRMSPNSITLTTSSSYNITSPVIFQFADNTMKMRACGIEIIKSSDTPNSFVFSGYVTVVT